MSTLDGDGPCAECGAEDNIVWFTDNVFWNAVVRKIAQDRWGKGDAILCIPCFVKIAEALGYRPTAWRLIPDWPWRIWESEPLPERPPHQWSDLLGIDPDFTGGKPTDEWLDEQRGEA